MSLNNFKVNVAAAIWEGSADILFPNRMSFIVWKQRFNHSATVLFIVTPCRGKITLIIATVIDVTILDCWQVMLTELCFTGSNSSDVLTNREWIACWVWWLALENREEKREKKIFFKTWKTISSAYAPEMKLQSDLIHYCLTTNALYCCYTDILWICLNITINSGTNRRENWFLNPFPYWETHQLELMWSE